MCVPSEPTFRIWIGRRSKSAGLAGEAKCSIASRSARARRGSSSRRSVRNGSFGCPSSGSMFSMPPGEQVVDARPPRSPSSSRRSAQVRADEAGASGDENPLQASVRAHAILPFWRQRRIGRAQVGAQRVPPAPSGVRRAPRPSSSPAPSRSDAGPADSSPRVRIRSTARSAKPASSRLARATSHHVASPRFARWYSPRAPASTRAWIPPRDRRRRSVARAGRRRRAAAWSRPARRRAAACARIVRDEVAPASEDPAGAHDQRRRAARPARAARPRACCGRTRSAAPVGSSSVIRAGRRRRRRRSRSRRGRAGSRAPRRSAPSAPAPSAFARRAASGSRLAAIDVRQRRGIHDDVGPPDPSRKLASDGADRRCRARAGRRPPRPSHSGRRSQQRAQRRDRAGPGSR